MRKRKIFCLVRVTGKVYNLSGMKKIQILIIALLALGSPFLFSLDIFLNDVLWHSYSSSDLQDLRIELSRGMKEEQGIPLAEILPLMSELDGIRINIPGGDILLDENISSLRTARLLSPPHRDGNEWFMAVVDE